MEEQRKLEEEEAERIEEEARRLREAVEIENERKAAQAALEEEEASKTEKRDMALGSAEKDLDSYDMFEGEALT